MTQKARVSGRSMARWFWGGFITILLVAVLLALFATIRGGKQWLENTLVHDDSLPETWTEVIQVTLSGGEAVYIDRASLPAIRTQTQTWIEHRAERVQEELLAPLDSETDIIFQRACAQVPVFADWYYSLAGEYARLFYAAFGNLPDYISKQLQLHVFQPAGTAEAIDGLTAGLDASLAEKFNLAALDLQGLLMRLIREHQVNADEVNIQVGGQWALATQLAERLETYVSLGPQDIVRQGVATSAGVAASAVTMKKLGAATVSKVSAKFAAKPSLGALATAATKLGLKSATKAGGTLAGAGTGATTGAALCAGTVAGAPLAPGCALVGGALTGLATWVLVDKAVLETEELLNRETFEEELREALETQRRELITVLKERYTGAIQSSFEQIRQDFDKQVRPANTTPKKDFVPAQAAQGE